MSWTSASVAARIWTSLASAISIRSLGDRLQPRVGPQLTADLGAGLALEADDVGGEVEGAAQQRRADAVGVDRGADLLEAFDLLGGEAAGDDDLHLLVAGVVERLADLADELDADPAQALLPALARLLRQRAVDQALGGVEADAPELRADRVGYRNRVGDGVVVEVDQGDDVD